MTERKAITDKMKRQSLIYWGAVVCPECSVHLQPDDEIEWDHRHALTFDGKHRYDNIRPMHVTCHTQKTIRDVKANAKTKRVPRKMMVDKPPPSDRHSKGGFARAFVLTPERRAEIASKAAKTRWAKRKFESRPFQRKAG